MWCRGGRLAGGSSSRWRSDGGEEGHRKGESDGKDGSTLSPAAGWEVVGDAAAAAAAVGGGNYGPPRWRTSCTRSLTRNMDSPGRCESEKKQCQCLATSGRGRVGVGRLETDSPGRDPGGLARVERVERVERVLEMSCSRLVGWQVCLG